MQCCNLPDCLSCWPCWDGWAKPSLANKKAMLRSLVAYHTAVQGSQALLSQFCLALLVKLACCSPVLHCKAFCPVHPFLSLHALITSCALLFCAVGGCCFCRGLLIYLSSPGMRSASETSYVLQKVVFLYLPSSC